MRPLALLCAAALIHPATGGAEPFTGRTTSASSGSVAIGNPEPSAGDTTDLEGVMGGSLGAMAGAAVGARIGGLPGAIAGGYAGAAIGSDAIATPGGWQGCEAGTQALEGSCPPEGRGD
ncbi:hypothetical protein [Tropicimonas sp. IMCC34043]|uniref:hypothetical protein n=1 Tax=Tropicimonas sp. IMCC34043 TaxID=2248760 RepID=UPI000E27C623|nr:hypothetical protein [Tropicimonas sp. IMCC34043]